MIFWERLYDVFFIGVVVVLMVLTYIVLGVLLYDTGQRVVGLLL